MKVRMKIHVQGNRYDADGAPVKWPRHGEALECSDAEGADLCRNGYAEPVKASPTTRVKKSPETTAKRGDRS